MSQDPATLAVRPAIRRLRDQLGGSVEKVATDDPRRKRFGALHGISMLLLLLQLACAATALLAIAL